LAAFSGFRVTDSGGVQSAAFQLAKPAFNGIQPRGPGWCEVELESGMFRRPDFHLWRFVSRAVAENQMKIPLFSVFLDQFVAESREILWRGGVV